MNDDEGDEADPILAYVAIGAVEGDLHGGEAANRSLVTVQPRSESSQMMMCFTPS